MVKFVLASLFISACAVSFAQDDIKLGDAKPVDIHVTDVAWQPSGKALLYRREQENGFALGVYAAGGYEGKVLIPLAKEDFWEPFWLAGSNSALIVIRSDVLQAKVKSTLIRIILVDADTKKATSLYSETFENKIVPGVEVNVSPSLRHAIVTLRNEKGSTHKVLPLGGGSLVDSPDLDRAEKEGNSGPTWSLDGTAIYSNAAGTKSGTFTTSDGATLAIAFDDVNSNKVARLGSADIQISGVTTDVGGGNPQVYTKVLTFRRLIPSPPTGSNVLELMTGSPILRPVRFRGPWIGKASPSSNLIPQNQSLVLKFDHSNAQDTSVWLTRGKEKGAPATLVAVHANNTWISNPKTGIAYVIDGALFFRSVGQ